MALLIRGGLVVGAREQYAADVLVEEGRIAAVGRGLDGGGARTLDASGCYVLPGGVDPHVHLAMPLDGLDTCDDFTSGTAAAAAGGTTSHVDFCLQQPGQPFADALAAWHRKLADEPPLTDVGFHLLVTDFDGGGGDAGVAEAVAGGVASVKLFMAYKGALMVADDVVFRAMRAAARERAVAMVHPESGDVIEALIAEALAEGRTSPRNHALTRPPATEGEATERAIALAAMAGCRLYVAHVSCVEALAPVARARAAGADVWAETCPQYLLLDERVLDADERSAARFVFTPPPRARSNQEPLWRALADDVLSIVSTDHAPYTLAQKARGRDDFSRIPNGLPGVEHRLTLLHHFGVRAGRISLPRLVELTAAAPARLFGLAGRKGAIAPGADADLVIFDPERRQTISAATHRTRADYDPYEGIDVVGAPRTVLVRGREVVVDGAVVGEPGHGRFLPRDRAPAPAAPPPPAAPPSPAA